MKDLINEGREIYSKFKSQINESESKVQRWDTFDKWKLSPNDWIRDPKGNWVKYEDVEALENDIAELIEFTKTVLEEVNAGKYKTEADDYSVKKLIKKYSN